MKIIDQDDIAKLFNIYSTRMMQTDSYSTEFKELKVLMYLGTQYQEQVILEYINSLKKDIRYVR
ncbi:Uncharacterised protein [Escherichia coli]|uniref:Uncharacterized protein n=1 Tax=Escherichia phage 121Q TaxID=1555202 RepID=A0A097EXX6_9CAUD|nr:hypothetical protein PBI_121Q_380 [Escherichia phage 121Q]QBO62034.1 hypothetical protein G17_00545 [Escherichia phage vB_EcoM_G17]QDF14055.1 hypothetical protein vBEcoMphAPEC6_gp432c [Escherichia phage vB_EcoM_phAPEC6]WNN14860.1 hypothetical protein Sharanji_gp579 [Escherichia phage Sharanji]VVZ31079.1 Uncharacterised protein [Escherichia coli]AIT14270.1 hypothetical protein PBI_121Q_380 [Escherichia phage 121Q]